jgi:hypothetical protein
MKAQILKIAGVKSEAEFYKKYPTEKAFFEAHPEAQMMMRNGGEMIKRADGSYSKRGLWDNIRANRGSGKKPTPEMLEQERKINSKAQLGGIMGGFNMGMVQDKQNQLMGMADGLQKKYGPMFMQLAPMLLQDGGEPTPAQILQEKIRKQNEITQAGAILTNAFMKKGGSTYSGGVWFQDGGSSIKPISASKPLTYKKGGSTYSGGVWFGDGGDSDLQRVGDAIGTGVNAGLSVLDKGLAYGIKGAKWVGKNVFGKDDIIPNSVKNYIYKSVRPIVYPDNLFIAAGQFLRNNKAKPVVDKNGDPRMDEEAWSRVLGRPTKSKYFVPSQYKPTVATDPNAEYYQMAPGIIDEERMKRILNDNYFSRNGRKNKAGKEYVPLQGMEPLLRQQFLKDYKQNPKEDFYESDPLANFQVYRDKDPKTGKPYLAISDTYDFGLESANEMIKPMNIYHRIYGKGGSTYSGGVWFEDGGIHINPANKGKFTASAQHAGMGVQEFASHVLANKEDYSPTQVKRANFARNASKWNHEYGGTPMMQYAGQTPDSNDNSWINKIFEYEASKGSAQGTGLSNFGYNNPRGFKKDLKSGLYTDTKGNLYNGTGKWTAPKTMGEAVNQFTKEYLPDLTGYTPGMKERAGDFLYNTGEDARLYQLDQYVRKYENMPNGLENRGQYRANGPKANEFNNLYGQYQSKIDALPMEERIGLMDAGRDYYYKNINNVNGQPSAAYNATWKPRVGMWGNYTAPQQTNSQQQVAAPVMQQPERNIQQVNTAPNLQVKQQPVGNFTLPNLTAVPSMPSFGPSGAQTATNSTGILNQNQNTSGLNSQYKIGTQTMGTIPKSNITTQAPAGQLPSGTLFNPGSFGSGANQFAVPGSLNLSTTGKNPYLNEAMKGKEYDPNATGLAGVDVSGMFAKTAAAGNQQSKANFNQKLGAVQNKLAEGMAGDPFIGAAGDIIEGINNHNDYNDALNKQRQNYSTDYAYNTSNTTANNKGQYDMYGTMMPNQIGGNLSFTGMNQKYNMPNKMYELGGNYASSSLSLIPNDIGTPMDFTPSNLPFSEVSNVDTPASNNDVAAYSSTSSNNDISALPLDADAMLATIGLQESSSKKGQTALGLKTKLVGPSGKRGTASGTFQITKGTLKGLYDKHYSGQYNSFDQFEKQFNTNPEVEYSAAKTLMNDHIKQYGIYALGAWYQPSFAARAAKGDMSVMNQIPAPEYGNKVTFGDYFNKSINNYRKTLGFTDVPYTTGNVKTKPGVNINDLKPNLKSFTSDIANQFPGIVISSGNDSNQHMKGSRHYENKAIDIGANSSKKADYSRLKQYLAQNPQIKQQYGIEDIIDEGDHMHIELLREGGEVELTAAQIQRIRSMGGEVEFI